MRIYLTLFLLGSVMLTGCADDLMGPTMEASGIDAPVTMREAGPPTFFKMWEAPDSPAAYQMSFRSTERTNQPPGADDAQLSFAGYGAYIPQNAFSSPENPAQPVGISIIGSVGQNRSVSFEIMNADGKRIADVKGQADESYERLELDIDFADGTSRSVVLSPAVNGISAP